MFLCFAVQRVPLVIYERSYSMSRIATGNNHKLHSKFGYKCFIKSEHKIPDHITRVRVCIWVCVKTCVSHTFLLNYWLKIVGVASVQDHLSMGLLNSQLGTSFSPVNTVVTEQMFSCNWAALDFHTTSNFSLQPRASTTKPTVVSCNNSRNRLKICF